jgi:hypothetical protein
MNDIGTPGQTTFQQFPEKNAIHSDACLSNASRLHINRSAIMQANGEKCQAHERTLI